MRELKKEEVKEVGGGAAPKDPTHFCEDPETDPGPIQDFNPPVDQT